MEATVSTTFCCWCWAAFRAAALVIAGEPILQIEGRFAEEGVVTLVLDGQRLPQDGPGGLGGCAPVVGFELFGVVGGRGGAGCFPNDAGA